MKYEIVKKAGESLNKMLVITDHARERLFKANRGVYEIMDVPLENLEELSKKELEDFLCCFFKENDILKIHSTAFYIGGIVFSIKEDSGTFVITTILGSYRFYVWEKAERKEEKTSVKVKSAI